MTIHLVWDASALYYAAKADRLDVLGELAAGPDDDSWRNVTTQAVYEELATHGLSLTSAGWLEIVHVDGLNELTALARWVVRVGAASHHRGEATVLAWADVHQAIAIIDDGDARTTGRAHGLEVHGSLWVVTESVRRGRINETTAGSLADTLLSHGARFPFGRGNFISWARTAKLLP